MKVVTPGKVKVAVKSNDNIHATTATMTRTTKRTPTRRKDHCLKNGSFREESARIIWESGNWKNLVKHPDCWIVAPLPKNFLEASASCDFGFCVLTVSQKHVWSQRTINYGWSAFTLNREYTQSFLLPV